MQPYRFGDVFSLFFDPRVLPLFIIGSLAIAIAGNSVYDLSIGFLGNDNKSLIIILVSAILILILAALLLSIILRLLRKRQIVVTDQPSPAKRKGLIFLVSHLDPLEKAFSYHRPVLSRCWLICTEKSFTIAQKFKADHECEVTSVLIKVINDPFDWKETKNIIDEIYRSKPDNWDENDIITDFTGLTKPVSVGAILACIMNERPVQYVPATYEAKKDHQVAEAPGEPIEIRIDYKTLKR